MTELTTTTKMLPAKVAGKLVYPKSADVLKAACFETVGRYIGARHANIAAIIAGRPILEECRGAE